jgi:hypothetical protein
MRILLPFWRGWRERTFYQDFYQGLKEALLELGHEPVPFSYQAVGEPAQEEAQMLFREVERGNISAVFDLVGWSYGLSGITLSMSNGQKEPIFDAFGIPYASMLCDQPYNTGLNGVRSRKLYGAYPDLGHKEQVRLAFPALKLAGEIFVPPAIRAGNDRSAPAWATDRDTDVLYVGNLEPNAIHRFWNDPQSPLWSASYLPDFCDILADAALDKPDRSLHLSVQAAIATFGAPPPGFDFQSQLRAVEGFLRYVFRHDAVVALARSGVRMRVVGSGWDRIPLPDTVELVAETDYEGFFRLAGQAKICLDASTYLDGANDRVFSYASSRAVCFTNAAGYLRPAFGEKNGMRFYSMANLPALGEQVKSLLARPDEMRESGERARQTVVSSHTWKHRVADMLAAMRLRPASLSTILPPPPIGR